MKTLLARGSQWHKWDLHIHTDASDGNGTCEEILEEANSKDIKCIAITDHHTFANVDKMKELAKPYGISVFSGVEFRSEYGSSSVHFIGLFPNEYKGQSLTSTFLQENVMDFLSLSRSSIIQKGREKNPKETNVNTLFKKGMFCVQVDFKEAANIIHKYGGLVLVHAGSKENGIDKEMKHDGSGPHNTSIENSLGPVKEKLFKDGYIDICEVSKPSEAQFYKETFGKPSILASDAHNVKDVGNKFCWIKADLTFAGLKQILAEPERVSFDEPPLLQRIKKSPDKYIKSVNIQRVDGATMSEIWFDKFHIDINPGLVAIIGNKGSGKSAIADILALCADSKNENYSFLASNKFRMSRPYNRSKQIEATIEWLDGNCSPIKTLDSAIDGNQPERIKYIPQNFLENLCTTENDEDFEKELKKIIFQYLDETQRCGNEDLDALIKNLTTINVQCCKDIQERIKNINAAIIVLEDMSEPDYKIRLENELKYKNEILSNTQKDEPDEVAEPDVVDEEAQKYLAELQKTLYEIEEQIEAKKSEQAKIYKKIQVLSKVEGELDRINIQIHEKIQEITDEVAKFDIQIEELIKIHYNPKILEEKKQLLKSEYESLKELIDENVKDSLAWKKIEMQKLIDKEALKLSEPEIKYQNYLKQKKEWERAIAEIYGSEEKEGSIIYLSTRIKYIEQRLPEELENLKEERKWEVLTLISKKAEILETYRNLFEPIVRFIEKYNEFLRDYPIEFNAMFSIKDFEAHFFDYVSQQPAGSFCGIEQGAMRIKRMIDNVDFLDWNSIANFPIHINENLQHDKRDGNCNAPRSINNQLKIGHDRQQLYDYIYSLDYLVPSFQLKMNGKALSLLSPGERGALLLLLYLFVDIDDKPLIIDQPEENLDNESVYKYIVHFIKEAKERRQIIMVTHNPNLAVVCDADQIIQMKIDKEKGNIVSFESGAIENPKINKIIVDVLEGTYPAFHNRDCKYFDKTL